MVAPLRSGVRSVEQSFDTERVFQRQLIQDWTRTGLEIFGFEQGGNPRLTSNGIGNMLSVTFFDRQGLGSKIWQRFFR